MAVRALLFAAAALQGLAVQAAASADDTVSATIGMPTAGLPPLPPNFASFSYEVSCIPAMFTYNGGARQSFINLMNALRSASGGTAGPNIRIGGNSADKSAYLPANVPLPPNITYRITDSDFAAYAAAVPQWNGTITPGVNFKDGPNASLAIAHLQGLSRVIPFSSPIWEAVEIGNENDLYHSNGIRPPTWTRQDYVTEWNSVVASLQQQAGLPASRVQGATFCCNSTGFDLILPDYISKGVQQQLLKSMSYHDYPLNVCSHQKNSVYSLLANAASDTDAAKLQPYVQAALAAGIPFYIGEGNSVACGGQANVSDVFAATLWALDAMLAHASVGITRWNFHGCSGGAYTAIAYDTAAGAPDTPQVQPLFYAMWAMATAVRSYPQVLSTTVTSSNPLIRVWALGETAGQGLTRVILIHKDGNATAPASVAITPASGAAKGKATLTRVAPAADGIFAHAGISFGGLTFDGSTDGRPVGTPSSESVPAVNGAFAFALPPASIAILEFKD